MPLARRFPLLIASGLLAVSCQGGPDDTAGPNRDIEASAPSVCRQNGDFGQVVDVYLSNQTQSEKLGVCRDVESAVASGLNAAAEQGINVLLAGISQDSQNCLDGDAGTECVLVTTGLAQAVSDFAGETCDLFPALAADECLVPTATDVTNGEWVAAGPVGEGAIVSLPNDSFAVQIDNLKAAQQTSGIFVAIRENDPTGALGPCPGTYENDCEEQNHSVDTDPESSFELNGLYVEICEEEGFVAEVASCSGGICAAGNQVDPPRDITACSKGALFSATSEFVGTDDDERVRDVLCDVRSRSAGISTGTLCQLFSDPDDDGDADGAAIGTCVTEATGQKSGNCLIDPAPEVPGDDTCFVLVGEKVDGTGSHRGEIAFCMSPDDPERGVTESVRVNVVPQE